jgi:DNA-binding NarL/FixJ family response regulator
MRIALCDDVAEMRALLRSALEAQGDVRIVGEADDGDRAVELTAHAQPDIIVVDLDMPGPVASALLTALRRAAPGAAIVTFSGHDPVAVAGDAANAISLHLPKTTELSVGARAVCELGRSRLRS